LFGKLKTSVIQGNILYNTLFKLLKGENYIDYLRLMKRKIRQEKDTAYHNCHDNLLKELATEEAQQHKTNAAMEKWVCSWLSALLIKTIGYALRGWPNYGPHLAHQPV